MHGGLISAAMPSKVEYAQPRSPFWPMIQAQPMALPMPFRACVHRVNLLLGAARRHVQSLQRQVIAEPCCSFYFVWVQSLLHFCTSCAGCCSRIRRMRIHSWSLSWEVWKQIDTHAMHVDDPRSYVHHWARRAVILVVSLLTRSDTGNRCSNCLGSGVDRSTEHLLSLMQNMESPN